MAETNANEKPKEMMEQIMGSMGRQQIIICLCVYITKLPIAWHLIAQGIMVPKSTPIYCINTTKAITPEMSPKQLKALLTEACSESCPEIIMDKRFYEHTIVNDFELYCGASRFLASFAQTSVMLGVFFGSIIFGCVADKFGRKIPFVISVVCQVPFGVGAAISPNIWLFIIFKFILNIFVGGSMITGFVLMSELVGMNWRSTVGIVYHIPFIIGHVLLSVFGYVFSSWRHFQLCISIPSILGIIFYWILPESPRWLMIVGKTEQCIKELEFMAKRNHLPTEDIRQRVEAEVARRQATGVTQPKKGKCSDLFFTRFMMLITLGMWVMWFAVGAGFYGAAQFVGSVGKNVYLNYSITAIIQLPSTLFILICYYFWGRKYSLMAANIISAIGLILIYFMPNPTLKVVAAAIAMFGLAMVFSGIYVYTGELFPTVVRNVGVGSSSMIGRIGGIASSIAAMVSDLNEVHLDWVPCFIYSFFAICAAVFCYFLPETKDRKLPDTIDEVKNFKIRRVKSSTK